MAVTGNAGDANSLAGDFGETWLRVVASACGMLHHPPSSLDLEKADVPITLQEFVNGTYNPHVLVQVKTVTDDLRVDRNGDYVYDLDVTTYNVLRRVDHSRRRILVVFRVSDPGGRVRLEPDGTLLVGYGAWMSLEGWPDTSNTSTIAVTLPAANTLDAVGMRRMLTDFGIRSTTRVPDIDPWDGGKP